MSRLCPRTRFAAVTFFSLAMLWASMPCAAAVHHHKKHVREQVEDIATQWRTAQLNDDVSAMDKLLSDDYLGITAYGQVVTKAQQLDRMRDRNITLSRLDVSDFKVKLIGQIAIVTSLAQLEGVADGKPLRGSFRYTQVYQRLASSAWRITSFEATRVPGAKAKTVAATVPESSR